MICAKCGAESASGMKFCGHCGAQLEVEHQTPERRQLTVFFCDIVGSTALAERLDPEEYGKVLSSFQKTVTTAVENRGGHIAQLLGDGVLAYFGYPVAHENGPDLAVAAAVALMADLKKNRATGGTGPDNEKFVRARIGIHTGPVVIDPQTDVKERRNLALGNTPNIAARLQQVADPNTILLSEDTRRLLHTEPKLQSLGPHALKGLSQPVDIHRVLAGDPKQDIPSGARPFSLSPMVNREPEIARLSAGWENARMGQSYAALIEGDAGVGKSRLTRHFISTIEHQADVLTGNCSALRSASALFPVNQMLRATLDLAASAAVEKQLESLRTELVRLNLEESLLSGLAASLRLPLEDRWFAAASPEFRRRRTHLALHQWLYARSRYRPMVLIIEDLHWSDPSTLEWLGDLLDGGARHALFVLMTSRAGSLESADGKTIDVLQISGLEHHHAEQLVRGIAGASLISKTGRTRLLEEADGVPLYLEEMTRGVLEAQDQAAHNAKDRAELGIPNSLQALLTARLDRLHSSKPLAQWAGVLGRTFPLELLRTVTATLATDFEASFSDLIHAGILERETPVGGRYRFRHALFQEAAYRSLLRADRRNRHRAIAEVLVQGSPEVIAGPDEVAHHFAEAGLGREAAQWWLKAGDEALARSENAESIAFLRRGLVAVESLASADNQALTLHLEGSLAIALTAARGYAAAEVESLHGSVRVRAQRLGDSREIFSSLRHTLPFYLVRAKHERARAIGEELVEMATRLADSSLLMEAHLALATACVWLGEASESRHHASKALSIYEPQTHAAHAVEFGQDPGTLSNLYAAWSNWWLGSFDEARRHLVDALTLARARDHPHSLAMTLDHGCSLRLYFQEWEEARELVREQLEVSKRYGFSMWAAMAGFRNAWLDCLAGELDSGIARMKGALEAFRATGAEIARPLHLSYLAQAHLLAGNGEAGLEVVEEALLSAATNGESHFVAEIHRIAGELAFLADAELSLRARTYFQTAIETARQQGARALELRAALSWHDVAGEDDRPSAMADLGQIVSSLADAGDASDLVAAQAALAPKR